MDTNISVKNKVFTFCSLRVGDDWEASDVVEIYQNKSKTTIYGYKK